ASQALGGRALLRLARPQSPSGERLRGHHRLGHCLPLCRIRAAAHAAAGSFGLRFESDSQTFAVENALDMSNKLMWEIEAYRDEPELTPKLWRAFNCAVTAWHI